MIVMVAVLHTADVRYLWRVGTCLANFQMNERSLYFERTAAAKQHQIEIGICAQLALEAGSGECVECYQRQCETPCTLCMCRHSTQSSADTRMPGYW
jgi:hypothetical protein